MIHRSFQFISLIIVLGFTACVKETYNMGTLSKSAHLSPTLAISAVKGDIAFSDMVKASDTVVFDQNKLVTFVFRRESVVNLKMSDFTKTTPVATASIHPGSFNLNINEILSHISGDFLISNPSIKFEYTNSFTDTVYINLKASGKRSSKTVDLNLSSFALAKPNIPVQQVINSTYIIDKTNSNLPVLISLPPELINYSGTVTLTSSSKNSQDGNNALGAGQLTGSLEIDVPMELKFNNLQYTDTVDNFIKNDNNSGQIKPEDFKKLGVNILAKNGFPLGAALKMSLYDSATGSVKSSVIANEILGSAPVDATGKSTGTTETETTIDFSSEFLSQINKADKIIFWFTFNSTDNGVVKIYSDYRINFNASLVVQPDINLN